MDAALLLASWALALGVVVCQEVVQRGCSKRRRASVRIPTSIV